MLISHSPTSEEFRMQSREDSGPGQVSHPSLPPSQPAVRQELSPVAPLVPPGTATPGSDHPSGPGAVIAQVASGPFLWALILAVLLIRWRSHLDRIVEAIAKRFESDGPVEIGSIKLPTVVEAGFSKGTTSPDSQPTTTDIMSVSEDIGGIQVTRKRVDME